MVFKWDVAVNDAGNGANDDLAEASGTRRRHPLVTLLVALLALESIALGVVTVYLVFEDIVAPADSRISAIALTVVVAIAAIWVAVIAVNALRGNAWIRGAAIVVQVLLGAVAIGSFQGIGNRPDIGWAVLLPAIAVLVLLFTKPVLAATARRDD